jgi:hypothetical protein
MRPQMWAGKYSRVSPDDFKRTIADFAPQFSGYSQHDSQEVCILVSAIIRVAQPEAVAQAQSDCDWLHTMTMCRRWQAWRFIVLLRASMCNKSKKIRSHFAIFF